MRSRDVLAKSLSGSGSLETIIPNKYRDFNPASYKKKLYRDNKKGGTCPPCLADDRWLQETQPRCGVVKPRCERHTVRSHGDDYRLVAGTVQLGRERKIDGIYTGFNQGPAGQNSSTADGLAAYPNRDYTGCRICYSGNTKSQNRGS